MTICISGPTCHPCSQGCPQLSPQRWHPPPPRAPLLQVGPWRGGVTPSPGAAWPPGPCHTIPDVGPCCPRGGASLSLEWYHTVPGMVAHCPQGGGMPSPRQRPQSRARWGRRSCSAPPGGMLRRPRGPNQDAEVAAGSHQQLLWWVWHGPTRGQQPPGVGCRGGGVQKPHGDICHPKGELWRGEEGSGRKPRRRPGVAALAGGRKRLLGESKSEQRKKRAKPTRRDKGVWASLSTPTLSTPGPPS